jgi:hypothetical protein
MSTYNKIKSTYIKSTETTDKISYLGTTDNVLFANGNAAISGNLLVAGSLLRTENFTIVNGNLSSPNIGTNNYIYRQTMSG